MCVWGGACLCECVQQGLVNMRNKCQPQFVMTKVCCLPLSTNELQDTVDNMFSVVSMETALSVFLLTSCLHYLAVTSVLLTTLILISEKQEGTWSFVWDYFQQRMNPLLPL